MRRALAGVGLRARLLLALVFTSAVTLGAAALALLPPLQERLREQDQDSLRAAALATKRPMENALRRDGYRVYVFGATANVARDLTRRTGARAIVFDAVPRPVYDTGTTRTARADVIRVLATERVVLTSGQNETRVSLPLRQGRALWGVLALRKADTGVKATVDEVRDAFVKAALVGLGIALLLGLALSATLSRRLGRLRASALRLAREGPDAPPPYDEGADEVGDLARAFAAMQRALRRQEEARRRFVSTASHELRTPLTSLQGTLELLAEDLEDGRVDLADAQEQVAAARGELARIARLAAELLDLSRLDAQVELRSEPIELGELCRAVSAEFELRARDRQVTLDVVPPLGPVWARGDPGAVARILRILLDNALRFSPPDERIVIAAAYHGTEATVEVSDRGPGVPPAERGRIFERFERGSATGGEGGFGLGLAIGRELADKLGGSLMLDGTHSPGARFVLTLPIELPRGGAAERQREPGAVA